MTSTTTADDEAAMIEFVGTFASLSGSPPETLADLSDGVVLFEALSEIAPAYFDPTTIARHLGDNWALKSSNLRKLIRNLEDYYHEGLFKNADFSAVNLTAIAKESDPQHIRQLVEFVAAAAVTCADKGTYVQRILGMSPDNQVEMKAILEQSLSKLTDYVDDEDDGDENELVFDGDEDEEEVDLEGTAASTGMFGGHHVNDGMEEDLAEAQRTIGTLQSQLKVQNQDNERAQQKLRAVVEDLQDRLVKRQDDLIQLEEDLRTTTTELEDAKAKLVDVQTQNSQLADDLDVANAKAQQLHRAEATVLAYKKRLEGMGSMNQQMSDLEDQSANYLRQIMELETQVKKSTALQRQVHELEDQITKLDKDKASLTSTNATAQADVAELKAQLLAANQAKKQYEEELSELRAQAEVDTGATADAPVASLAAGMTDSASKEQVTRLQIEKEALQKEVEKLNKTVVSQQSELATTAKAAAAATAVSTAAKTSDSEEVAELKRQLEAKNKEIVKISSDKDKLETYTKRTLAKFQEKYLVALQECKAKLKEKQDKIESLESRSASERTAQKREERLLSSTIYELGLAIMQNRLKER